MYLHVDCWGKGEHIGINYPQISQIYADFLGKRVAKCATHPKYRICAICGVWKKSAD